jgi:3-methyladenine DNA glycosylase AlkD
MTGNFMKKDWTNTDYRELLRYMESVSDEKYRAFSAKLIPHTDNFIGLPMPVIQGLAKEITKGNWQAYLSLAGDAMHEELLLQAAVLGYIKIKKDLDLEQMLILIKDFVPKINNWAVCDTFCSGLKFTHKHQKQMYDFLLPYLSAQNEFGLRFAVVMLMQYFIDDDHIDELLQIFDGIEHEGYYLKMAVAWAVSICFIKYRDRTLAYLQKSKMDDFTYNKALQKIIESQRVSKEDKNIMRKLKRK